MPVLTGLGALLVLSALYDGLKTTLSAQGGAPVTSALSAGLWAALGRGPAHGLSRRAAGGAILTAVPVAWTLLLWAGWTLVFSGVEGAVVDAASKAPADLPARVYFVGFTVFTLGIGDYVPSGATWQVLAAASFTGLFLITLAITYLLPVVQAAAEKRSLAGRIHALGATGTAIAARAPGASLEGQLESVASDLTLHAERHLAYPVLHYFESPSDRNALAPRLAALSDALLLRHGLPEPSAPTRPPSAPSSPRSTATSTPSAARSRAPRRKPHRRPPTASAARRPTRAAPSPTGPASGSDSAGSSAPSSVRAGTTGPASSEAPVSAQRPGGRPATTESGLVGGEGAAAFGGLDLRVPGPRTAPTANL